MARPTAPKNAREQALEVIAALIKKNEQVSDEDLGQISIAYCADEGIYHIKVKSLVTDNGTLLNSITTSLNGVKFGRLYYLPEEVDEANFRRQFSLLRNQIIRRIAKVQSEK